MKIKNTAPGGRGFGVGGKIVEWAAGETKDVPDGGVKDARLDPVVNGMFEDGTFVEVSAKAAAKATEVETDKGKPTK